MQSSMKILLLVRDYPSEKSYAYAFVHARAKMYVDNKQEVTVIVPSKYESIHCVEGIRVFRAPPYRIPLVFKKFNPEILAIHGLPFMYDFVRVHLKIVPLCKKLGIPIITWIHGAEGMFVASHHYLPSFGIKPNLIKFLGVLYDPAKRTLLRLLLRRSTCVVFASKWMKDVCEKYALFRHPRSYVIPNPVDVHSFTPSEEDIGNKIEKAVTVRSLEWKYGLDTAIKSFAKVKATLTILGQGSLEGYLRALARIHESNVIFLTKPIPHNEMPFFYKKYGFYIASSRTEGQGLAMCEAMSCGLPVIAAKVGGIPEFVIDGVNGLLVPPEDFLSLRKAVRNLISDKTLYNSLSHKAVEFCRKKLSFETIFAREYDIFKKSIELTDK